MAERLCLGEIGDPGAALPGGAGAQIFYLSEESYGQQVTSTGGEDSLFRLETDEYAIAGEHARTILRRIFVKVTWEQGPHGVDVTPLIDGGQPLPAESFTLEAVTRRTTKVLDVKVARVVSLVAVRVDVVARTGRVGVASLSCAHKPLAAPADYVAGTAP